MSGFNNVYIIFLKQNTVYACQICIVLYFKNAVKSFHMSFSSFIDQFLWLLSLVHISPSCPIYILMEGSDVWALNKGGPQGKLYAPKIIKSSFKM